MGCPHVGRIYDAGNWAVHAETEKFGQVCGAPDYEGWVTVPLKKAFRTKLHAAYVIAIDNVQFFGRTDQVFTYPPTKCVLSPSPLLPVQKPDRFVYLEA